MDLLIQYIFISLVVWGVNYLFGFGKFIWYDMWVGIFVDTKKQIIYIAPLPCFIIIYDTNRT